MPVAQPVAVRIVPVSPVCFDTNRLLWEREVEAIRADTELHPWSESAFPHRPEQHRLDRCERGQTVVRGHQTASLADESKAFERVRVAVGGLDEVRVL